MKKYIVPTVIASVLLLGLSSAFAFNDQATLNSKIPNLDELKSQIPKTLQDAEAQILPARIRYLMYTNDGSHIMWGFFGRGYFTGTDNLGKHSWGIYGKGIFAGFYDNNFFWGKYNKGTWKAQWLFDEQYTSGKYITFPLIAVAEATPIPQ